MLQIWHFKYTKNKKKYFFKGSMGEGKTFFYLKFPKIAIFDLLS